MVLPVTVLPDFMVGLDGQTTNSYCILKQRRRQTKPYNLVLPYLHVRRYCINLSQSGYPQVYNVDVMTHANVGLHASSYSTWNDSFTPYQNVRADVTNLALQRFIAKVGDPASLGITLVQYGEAMSMLTKRLTSLVKFSRALKKLNFRSAWKALDVSPTVHKRLVSKEAILKKHAKHYADMFLEVHFGWVPLVQDVYQSLKVLQSAIPYGKIHASAKVEQKWDGIVSTPSFWEVIRSYHTYEARCKIGAEVQVTNPNLYLMEQLGVLNPADVLWDGIPFSFVLGWFVNVQEVLRGYTAFAGCTLLNPYTTSSLRSHCRADRSNSYPGYQGVSSVTSVAFSVERLSSIPSYSLRFKGIKLPSVARGLTAASLLVQMLKH